MTKYYSIDGELAASGESVLPITDLAIVRGYGVFDFFRTYGGLPVQLQRNIKRLRNSAKVIGLDVPWEDDYICDVVLRTVERNGFDEANIRVIVTGGESPDFFTPQGASRLLVYVERLRPMPDEWYTHGVKVITFDEERQFPRAKSLNYIPAIVAVGEAKRQGAVEALYRDRRGNIREGTTTNVFAFYDDGRVVTPEVGILPGITRGRVIEILMGDYDVVEQPLAYDELLRADEVVITAANKQVVPVVEIDETRVGEKVGPHSQRLMTSFRDYMWSQADAER